MKTENVLKPDGFKISPLQLVFPTIFICVLSLSLPVLTLQVYDRILPNPESGTLPILIMGVCIAVCLEVGLRLTRAYVLGWSGAAYEHKMSCSAIKHVLSADLAALDKDGSGENLNRMSAISKLREFKNGYDIVTYTELAFIFLYLGLIAYIAGWLVLVPVIILSIFTIISVFMGSWLNRSLKERDQADDRRYNFLIESLQGVHTIKAFSLEKPFLRRYENIQSDATMANYSVTEATANTFNLAAVFAHIMLASVITFGAWQVLQGNMTSGGLIASILLSGRVMQPVQRALGLWTRYQDYQIAAEKVEEIFALPTMRHNDIIKEDVPRDGSLILRDVEFTGLFSNVALDLKIGQSIQITGPTGSGKTTLLKMMAGLYQVDGGDIEVDGYAPTDYKPQELMKHIGYMPTLGTIFRGRIRDNLTCFGTIPEDQVRVISAMLGIDSDVARLPRGFDTWMEGMEQDTVPPGLRQRIALARVLAAHPRIILFDNADRNLDREGYRQIHTMLGRLKDKVALIMVTEDQNLSRLADRRMVLTSGGLREVHVHNEVISMFKELRA